MTTNVKPIGLIACAVAAFGSFMPWISVKSIFGQLDFAGTDGDGKITLVLAIVAGIFCLMATPIKLRLGMIACGFGAFTSIFDMVRVNTRAADINGVAVASVGFGLYLCIIGFVVAFIALVSIHQAQIKAEKEMFPPPVIRV